MRCKLNGLTAKECGIAACLQFGLFEELKKNGSLHEKTKPQVLLHWSFFCGRRWASESKSLPFARQKGVRSNSTRS